MELVYLRTWMAAFYGKLVGKYTIPMDPMGYELWQGSFPFGVPSFFVA